MRRVRMNNKRPQVLVALGTNQPHGGLEGADLLAAALAAIEAAGVSVLAVSSAWKSAPQPPSDQPDYVNAAALVDPGLLGPGALYAVLAGVEHAFGRERRVRWAQRTLDLDIVDFGGLVGQFDGVELPHPRAHERAFVLAPLMELAPDWVHPSLGEPASALLSALPIETSTHSNGNNDLRSKVAEPK